MTGRRGAKGKKSTLGILLRRDLMLCRRGLGAMLAFAVFLGLFSYLALTSLSHGVESTFRPAPVAVVDREQTFLSRMAINLIAGQEFASPLEIAVETEEETAVEKLEAGEYSAVLLLPEGVSDDILTGASVQAVLLLSDRAAVYGDVVTLLAHFGEDLLAAGQFGVFAGEVLLSEATREEREAYLEAANTDYLLEAISLRWFTVEEVPYADTRTTAVEWYALLYLSLFFWLLTLVFLPLQSDCTTPILRRLRAAGVGHSFLWSKVLLSLFVRVIMLTGLCALLGLIPSLSALVQLFCALLFLSVTGTGLLLALPKSTCSGVVSVLGLAGLLCAGGIIPRVQLPRIIWAVGGVLPIETAARLFKSALVPGVAWSSLLTALIWSVLALLAARVRLERLCLGEGGAQ